jgi:hypothetical protein
LDTGGRHDRRGRGERENSSKIQFKLDTGCLIGDCMSQETVDKLNASHLIVNIYITICSGLIITVLVIFRRC